MKPDGNEPTDSNPLVDKLVDEALGPYRDMLGDVLSPELLAGFAETLELFLTTHPTAVATLEQLQPRADVAKSAEIDRSETPREDEAARASGTRGGRR